MQSKFFLRLIYHSNRDGKRHLIDKKFIFQKTVQDKVLCKIFFLNFINPIIIKLKSTFPGYKYPVELFIYIH